MDQILWEAQQLESTTAVLGDRSVHMTHPHGQLTHVRITFSDRTEVATPGQKIYIISLPEGGWDTAARLRAMCGLASGVRRAQKRG